jgi:hypothetical protein
LITVVLVACFIALSFIIGYNIGFDIGFKDGQRDVVENTVYHEAVSLNLSSNEVMTYLRRLFPEKLNYTQLLFWESSKLNYTNAAIERHTNPIDVLNYGLGRCGEFSILYVSICLANQIPARLVVPANIVPGIVDHLWAEVNPSKDDKTWVHVEPTDSYIRI